MHPQCRITIDGKQVSGVFMERLSSCRVTDKEGAEADSVSIELNDDPPAAIPRKGAIIRVWMGYQETGVSYMGAFTADDIEVALFPHSMSISGKSADLRKKMKETKSRNWDEKSLKDIVSEIAGDHGLAPKIDADIGARMYTWLGQEGESDISLLKRMASRHNALFSVKDGNLVFARKGSGRNASGAPLDQVTITRDNLETGSMRVKFSDKKEFKAVKAEYHDRGEAERKTVEMDSSEDGEATFVIGDVFADQAEALAAAQAKAKDLKREGITASCSVIGDPSIRAGAGASFAVGRVGIDGIPFIIETATHDFSPGGFKTSLDLKLEGQGKTKREPGKKRGSTPDDSEDNFKLPKHATLG